jgi:citrate lyase beta subunit
MKFSIPKNNLDAVYADLKVANDFYEKMYPGESENRQPVHTVYGGANLFKYDMADRFKKMSQKSFNAYTPNFVELAKCFKITGHNILPTKIEEINKLQALLDGMTETERTNHPAWLAYTVYNKVAEKLEREALEDFRIDFEDGFGNRPWDEEDRTAVEKAKEVAKAMEAGTLPPYIGIRIKPFTEELKERGVRTLDLFITALSEATGGKLPENFVVTIPKVEMAEQVTALVRLFEALEANTELAEGALTMEIMIETTQSIYNPEGGNNLRGLVAAAEGRCRGAHFGTYDYTASTNVIGAHQSMRHPVCTFAKHQMKVALAGTGIMISDGATNIMPVGPHRGDDLTHEQMAENKQIVHDALKLAYDDIQFSLYHGFYQGWDLNPAQLIARYTAVFSFFLEPYRESTKRLKTFVAQAAQATLTGDVFDDAATGQGLLNYFLLAMNAGAINQTEAEASTITLEEFRGKSFVKILDTRAKM